MNYQKIRKERTGFILLKLILCVFITASYTGALSQNREFKKVEFGFNIGYLGDLQKKELFEKPINQIKADGITNLRIYEPFNKIVVRNPQLLNDLLKPLVQDNFRILLCLSNYPSDSLADSRNSNFQANKAMLTFTDRWAPSNMDSYKGFLNKVLTGLKTDGLIDNISFEIGNEPDSKLYFWSDPTSFFNLAQATHSVLQNYNRPIYCCAFTSDFANNNLSYNQQYYGFLKNNMFQNGVNLSFHIYPNDKYNLQAITLPHLNGSIISEFNLFSYQTEKTDTKNAYFNSADFGSYLIELLFYAYQHNVKAVYLFNLVDSPKKIATLGFFDSAGNPKPAYGYFKQIYDVIRNGYTVARTNNQITISGHNKTIVYTMNGGAASKAYGFKKTGQWIIKNN